MTIEKLTLVEKKITSAFDDYQLPQRKINICVVTKKRNKEEILPILENNHRLFGENKVQEAEEKWPELKTKYPDVKLHMIGHLQSNKAREALKIFDVIESLDSDNLAKEILKEGKKLFGEKIHKYPLYVQVNIGREEQKHGIDPAYTTEFVNYCKHDLNLNICGLMCIPPHTRPLFKLASGEEFTGSTETQNRNVHKVHEDSSTGLTPKLPLEVELDKRSTEAFYYFNIMSALSRETAISHLSMGMSEDFEQAVICGSNEVRIGSLIFKDE